MHEAVKSRNAVDEWRVEAVDDDGEGDCCVTLFSGPSAERRAEEYAAWKNRTAPSPALLPGARPDTLRAEMLRAIERCDDRGMVTVTREWLVALQESFEHRRLCGANRSADPPQDCNWPLCGCDEHAERVITALREADMLRPALSPGAERIEADRED